MIVGIFVAEILVAFCTLAFEVIAARLVAPFAGMSMDSWVSIIAAFLLALAVGNHVGGVLAQHATPARLLGRVALVLLLAGASMAAIPPLLPFWDAVLLRPAPTEIWRVTLFCAVPCLPAGFFLGVVTPMLMIAILRLARGRGYAIGAFYAASALGSAFGALAALWLLLDLFGVRLSVATIAMLTLANAALVLLLARCVKHSGVRA